MIDVLRLILADSQISYLMAAILATFVIGVASALYTGTFRLANLADVGMRHLLPTLLIYGALALLAWANPALAPFRDGVFYLLLAPLAASIARNLASMGINLPPALVDVMAKVSFVSHISLDQVETTTPKIAVTPPVQAPPTSA